MRKASIVGLTLLSAAAAHAQTHAVKNQDAVVRAVSVYEWTGDLPKPTASRLVPVSVYIDRELQDAGVYLARPIPFAIENGTVFELEKSGVGTGTVELAYARHVQTPETPRIDDGWFAYGAVKLKDPEPVVPAKKSGPLSKVEVSGGKTQGGTTSADDDRPTLKRPDRSGAAGNGTTVSAGKADDDDSRKPDPDSDSAKDDPERPTLRKRTSAQTKAVDKKKQTASVTSASDLNDDPDRPSLHRGKPAGRMDEQDLPPLAGIPEDMHQMVAISDAKNRPDHDFTRPWDSPEERDLVMRSMRSLAAEKLAGYPGVLPPAPKAAPAKSTAAARRKVAVPAPPPPAPMFDAKSESLSGYTLSYGGAATYIFTAQTSGTPVPVYVTVVAQREPDGSLKAALSNVTDAAHLDRTPRFRLIDVVDPDASNRASLLFELRGQTQRQFALYRIIGAHADETIAAGSSEE